MVEHFPRILRKRGKSHQPLLTIYLNLPSWLGQVQTLRHAGYTVYANAVEQSISQKTAVLKESRDSIADTKYLCKVKTDFEGKGC